jgi:hypothetical protein
LIRPGRCFGTLCFRDHNYDEAIKFFKETGNEDKIEKIRKNNRYSLAELYSIINNKEFGNGLYRGNKKAGF